MASAMDMAFTVTCAHAAALPHIPDTTGDDESGAGLAGARVRFCMRLCENAAEVRNKNSAQGATALICQFGVCRAQNASSVRLDPCQASPAEHLCGLAFVEVIRYLM